MRCLPEGWVAMSPKDKVPIGSASNDNPGAGEEQCDSYNAEGKGDSTNPDTTPGEATERDNNSFRTKIEQEGVFFCRKIELIFLFFQISIFCK